MLSIALSSLTLIPSGLGCDNIYVTTDSQRHMDHDQEHPHV